MHCNAFTAMHCNALQYTIMQCTALHCAMHCEVSWELKCRMPVCRATVTAKAARLRLSLVRQRLFGRN